MPKPRLTPIAVATGECYLIRRTDKPAVKIRITRVARGVSTKHGERPIASYIRLDGTARDNWEPDAKYRRPMKRTHYQALRTMLTWRDGAWRLPFGAERVPCE